MAAQGGSGHEPGRRRSFIANLVRHSSGWAYPRMVSVLVGALPFLLAAVLHRAWLLACPRSRVPLTTTCG